MGRNDHHDLDMNADTIDMNDAITTWART